MNYQANMPQYESEAKTPGPVKPGKTVSSNGIRAAVSEVRGALEEAEVQLGELITQLDPISTGGTFYGNKFASPEVALPSPEPEPRNPIVEQLNEITARIEHVSRRLRSATNLLNEQL